MVGLGVPGTSFFCQIHSWFIWWSSWQFCWWPFWDGENVTFWKGCWWPPTIGDEKVTRVFFLLEFHLAKSYLVPLIVCKFVPEGCLLLCVVSASALHGRTHHFHCCQQAHVLVEWVARSSRRLSKRWSCNHRHLKLKMNMFFFEPSQENDQWPLKNTFFRKSSNEMT